MNAELLRRSAAMPVDMQHFFTKTECGTVGCLAGNICLIYGIKPQIDPELEFSSNLENGDFPENVAYRLARVPNFSLFYLNRWPERLKSGVQKNNPTQE